jgi:hypothetical protein
MKMIEKIDLRDELNDQIEDFFAEVCNFYLDNSLKWSNIVNKTSYSYSSFSYSHKKKNTLTITLSTRWEDYDEFDVSADILIVEDWKTLLDDVFKEEREKIQIDAAARKAKKEAQEREQLKILQEKYGQT